MWISWATCWTSWKTTGSTSKLARYLPPTGPEEQLFCRRVADAARRCGSCGRAQYLGFLDERQQALAEMQLARLQWAQSLFWGGYPGAERGVLALYDAAPPPLEEYPLCCLRITARGGGLTHRDYLGALLGLGLQRECLGDILPDEEGAYLFSLQPQAALIVRELVSVGRQKGRAEHCLPPPALAARAGQESCVSVASLRLDAVLAALLHKSRERAAELVRAEKVLVNHIPLGSPSALLEEGDNITVRGTGKFRLQQIGGPSKKGRIFVTCIKY